MMAAVNTDVRGELKQHVSLARYTSWGIGGQAEWLYRPADVDDLCHFLAGLDAQTAITWLGLGSNVLVRDGGLKGVVIHTQGVLNTLQINANGELEAQAGVSCAKVAKFAAAQQYSGLEFMAGIPGTVGGALAMNAGAFGGQTWDAVSHVDTVDRFGNRFRRSAEDYSIAYRAVDGPKEEWFVGASFRLLQTEENQASDSIKKLMRDRNSSQPIGQKSCGSVFKNPPGNHAAKLIEESGLKGYQIGQACVSEKHANFIINLGGASAADVEALIAHIQQVVRERYGIELEPEVKVLGVAR